ncbi:MAG: response regulator [Candidatus Tectomicrobia bacterium]|uniref:Response regulator n=1 Tax=Tectimicrobiota bacterium TaxID=2528274 RepID=A0A932MQG7_UNCTE|nr:response regulator [Candidatus Tectomicrobia bacterium]
MDEPRQPKPGPAPGKGRPALPSYRGRVLLAEDSPVNQMVARKLLGIFGCEVEVAESGEDALVLWEGGAFDLVFLDCRMPGMDGYEVARAIREREGGEARRTPIVALTAETTLDERRWCLEAGMDDFLPKPITAEAVGAVLSRWLSAAGAPPPPVPPAPPPREEPVLRLETLVSFIGMEGEPGEGGVIENMVKLFLSLTPPKLSSLRDAVGRSDGKAAEELAHALKSSCYAMGAWKMGDLCDRLEKLGVGGELGEAPALVESLEREFTRARSELALKPWER